MNRARTFCVTVAVAGIFTVLFAYERPVHRRITEAAFAKARVDLLRQLGTDRERRVAGDKPIVWVSNGSFDEDDIFESIPPFRSLHHFYDPVHGASLTVGTPPLCFAFIPTTSIPIPTVRADSWAVDSHLLNDWNLPRARDYQRQAILGPNPGTRDINAKSLFLSLGHMVHLIQDMAQPEHTRNDQHRFAFADTAPSLYEQWTLGNLINAPIVNAEAFFDSYPSVQLPSFKSYFHTDDGRGLADFANANFVTQDTNYDDEQSPRKCFHYLSSGPFLDLATPRVQRVQEQPRDGFGHLLPPIEVLETVYTSHPVDRYRPNFPETDGAHTVLSALDLETRFYDPSHPRFSLSPSSFHSRAAMLVPRAVGYSQGFIELLPR